MVIQFERRGGFMGLRLAAEVKLEDLPAEDANALYRAVVESDFFALPEVIATPSSGADRFHYRVVVQTEEVLHAVECSDAAAPETLRPLLERLTMLARSTTLNSPHKPGAV